MYIKNLLKTTAALATLFTGSQSWATDVTLYTPGFEDGAVRRDVIKLGATGGSFNGYADPTSTKVKTLEWHLVKTLETAAVAATTTKTSIAALVTTVYITGEADQLGAVATSAAVSLPTPTATSPTIIFALKSSPLAVPKWFCGTLPTGTTVIILPGSADPKLDDAFLTATIKEIKLGISIGLTAAGTIKAALSRHGEVAEKDAATKAQITMGGPTVFSATVKGVSISGAVAVTCNNDCEFVDPASGVAGFTVAAGKKLTIKGVSSNYAALPAVTLGAKSSVAVINAK